jgi:tyrosine-protein kinase Etk/Wzc
MPDNQATNALQQAYPDEDEINLLDLLIVLAKHKAMILKVTLGAAILAVIVTLLMPNVYTGTVRLLPPQKNESSASAFLGQLGGLAGVAGGSLGIKNQADLYIAMLESRTLMEKIVKRFDLQQVYKTKTLTDTLKVLQGQSSFSNDRKSGMITVEVSDHDPKRAADMTNAFVEELAQLMQNFALTDASQKRVFFEQQMKQAKDKLTDAEVRLDKTPNTSLQYMDAVRNVKYQEAVWEILAKQFEMAKLDEAKDFPLIQVLDKAIPPERKSKPKRSVIVITATLAAFLVSIFWAFIRESITRAEEQPEQAERLKTLRSALKLRTKD